MKKVTQIRQFLNMKDDVEVIWPGRFILSAENEWHVRVAIQRHSTSRLEGIDLPIGYMPLLSPGRCFSNGYPTDLSRRGDLGSFSISDLGEFERIDSQSLNQELLRKLAPIPKGPRSPATVFRYEYNGIDVFIPTVELVRALFLSLAVMANAIMRPQSLMGLCLTSNMGRDREIFLQFTREMPVSVLRGKGGISFIKHFAWIATDPEVRASWESVRRLSANDGVVDFRPPPLRSVRFEVRCLRLGNAMLVLEIINILGPGLPSKEIRFSHPDMKENSPRARFSQHRDGDKNQSDDEESELRQRTEKRFILEGHGAAGSRSRPDRISVSSVQPVGFSNSKVTAIRKSADPQEAEVGREIDPRENAVPGRERYMTGKVRTERIRASVAERGFGSSLIPLEFRLLPPYQGSDPEQLAPLTAIIDWMAERLPDVRIGRQLTIVPKTEKRISCIGSRPRPVLVAMMQPAGEPPRVLIEVDHSEEVSLSMLVLYYSKDLKLREIERDVQKALQGLVTKNGHWDRKIFAQRRSHLDCAWMPRVLRRQHALSDDEYITKWGLELINRLGIARYVV